VFMNQCHLDSTGWHGKLVDTIGMFRHSSLLGFPVFFKIHTCAPDQFLSLGLPTSGRGILEFPS